MLVDKRVDAVVLAAAKEKNINFDFSRINIDQDSGIVCAGNGHYVYFYKQETVQGEDYPEITPGENDRIGNILVPANIIEEAIKSRPKKCQVGVLNDNISITKIGDNVQVGTTDLKAGKTISFKPGGETWPDTKELLPELEKLVAGENVGAATFGVEDLEQMVKIAKRAGEKTILFSCVPDPEKPSKVEMRTSGITGYIMPWKK